MFYKPNKILIIILEKKMKKVLFNLFFLIAVVNGHLYLKSPPSRGVDSLGNELPLINQQGSGGYVDQYYYRGIIKIYLI